MLNLLNFCMYNVCDKIVQRNHIFKTLFKICKKIVFVLDIFVSGMQRCCGRHLPCQEAQALLSGQDLEECSVMSKLMSEFHKIKSKFSNGVKYDNSLEDPEQGSVIFM